MIHLCPQELSFLLYQLRFAWQLWWRVRAAWAQPYRFSSTHVTVACRERYL